MPQQLEHLCGRIRAALGLLTGRQVPFEAFEAPSPLTPFERKYRDSGQTLYRCVVELDHLEENPS
jgi:tRNA (guanine-N7-)-methyltransferase